MLFFVKSVIPVIILSIFINGAYAASLNPSKGNKTCAVYGLFRMSSGHPVSGGHVFAVNSDGVAIAHSTTKAGKGPDAGNWQLLRLPVGEQLTIIAFLEPLLPSLSIAEIKTQYGYNKINIPSLKLKHQSLSLDKQLGNNFTGLVAIITKYVGSGVKILDEKNSSELARNLIKDIPSLGDDRLDNRNDTNAAKKKITSDWDNRILGMWKSKNVKKNEVMGKAYTYIDYIIIKNNGTCNQIRKYSTGQEKKFDVKCSSNRSRREIYVITNKNVKRTIKYSLSNNNNSLKMQAIRPKKKNPVEFIRQKKLF